MSASRVIGWGVVVGVALAAAQRCDDDTHEHASPQVGIHEHVGQQVDECLVMSDGSKVYIRPNGSFFTDEVGLARKRFGPGFEGDPTTRLVDFEMDQSQRAMWIEFANEGGEVNRIQYGDKSIEVRSYVVSLDAAVHAAVMGARTSYGPDLVINLR